MAVIKPSLPSYPKILHTFTPLCNHLERAGAEFLKLVLFANLIAWPFAHYVMQDWLQNFAYRANLGVFPFIVSGLGAIVATILVVGYQAYKAATSNPVESLRHE